MLFPKPLLGQVNLVYNNSVVGRMAFSPMHLSKGNRTSILIEESDLDITDTELFAVLAKKMITEKSVLWTLEGTLTVWADIDGGVSIPFVGVKLSKDIVVPGIGGLVDLDLLEYDVSQSRASLFF